MANVNNVATGKYGIVNLRKVAGVKTGEHNIQYSLNATSFASTPCENGFLLVENHYAKTLDLPGAATDRVGLVACVEKMYDESDMSLGNFRLNINEFLPRIYRFKVGDMFDTNNFKYDDGDYANYAAIAAAIATPTTVYAYPSTNGQIELEPIQNAGAAVELQATRTVTMAGGESGLVFVCTKA
ncbi:MAG: hypothetical protein PHY08_08475 [Candidatus Cloacimonetes bacterium]|nr:hypothetical protein [Candidatus Cloacimonadota bacterium]